MKTKLKKYFFQFMITTFVIIGLNSLLHASEDANKYIEHPPVFTNQWNYPVEEDSVEYPPTYGAFSLGLTNPAQNEPSFYANMKTFFLGSSNKNSQIQVYAKASTWWTSVPFGDPINLELGTHVVEGTTKGVGKYAVTVEIKKEPLDIKVRSLSNLWGPYEKVDVYMVTIKKVEKIK